MKRQSTFISLTNLNSTKTVIRVAVFAQAVAIIIALAPGLVEDRWYRLGLSTLLTQWIAMGTLTVLYFLSRFGLVNKSSMITGVLSISTLLLVTYLISHAGYFLLDVYGADLRSSVTQFILLNLLISLIVGIIGIEFFLVHTERNESIKAQARAELEALEARIRPHFLFNSLNSVSELIQINPNAAEQSVIGLSNLFRAALNAGHTISLEEEWKVVESYLALEKWRLGERLTVQQELPSPLPKIMVPSLCIQPLVENAVKHGIETRRDGGVIQLDIIEDHQNISIRIENPCTTSCTAEHLKSGNGIAIENIRKRLYLEYGNKAHLAIQTTQDKFIAVLTLPLEA